MFKSDNSLDTIRKNLTNFFADLVAFFQKVFNFIMNGMNSMPKTSGSDAEDSSDTSGVA